MKINAFNPTWGCNPNSIHDLERIRIRFLNLKYEQNPVKAYAFTPFFHLFKNKEKAEKVERYLKEKHPYLFSTVTVKIGNVQRDFVRGDLMVQSPVLEKMFQYSKNQNVEFTDIDESIANTLMDFLATGNVNLEENPTQVIPLFVVAKFYELTSLSELCRVFIYCNFNEFDVYELLEVGVRCRDREILTPARTVLLALDEISIEKLFAMAVQCDNYTPVQFCLENIIWHNKVLLIEQFLEESFKYNDTNLQWYSLMLCFCFRRGSVITYFDISPENSTLLQCSQISEINSKNDHTAAIVQLAKLCSMHNIDPSFSESHKRQLSFRNIDKDISYLLRGLNILGIESLVFSGLDNETYLEIIASIIPRLDSLGFMGADLRKIPETWALSLKTIGMYCVSQITELNVPNADRVYVRWCPNLKSINAPNALVVNYFESAPKVVLNISGTCNLNTDVPYTKVDENDMYTYNTVTY